MPEGAVSSRKSQKFGGSCTNRAPIDLVECSIERFEGKRHPSTSTRITIRCIGFSNGKRICASPRRIIRAATPNSTANKSTPWSTPECCRVGRKESKLRFLGFLRDSSSPIAIWSGPPWTGCGQSTFRTN